jgi:iron complex outermembrane receptor protein
MENSPTKPDHCVTGRLLAGVALAALLSSPAAAQTSADRRDAEVETIIVTAQKRAENVQEVPLSVSAYSGQMLEKAGVSSLIDLAVVVPSFAVDSSSNVRNSSVSVRGIGSSGTNPGIEPSVGVFVDGVYLPSAGLIQGELLDIAAIEVLRGPQGTLYGRNTPVGAVNITTRRPSANSEMRLRAGAGNYGLRYANGYVTGGLTDQMAGSLSFWIRDRNGYEDNLATSRPTNSSETYGARARLAFDLADDTQIDVIAHYTKIEAICCAADHLVVTGPFGIATPGFLAAEAAAGRPFRNFDSYDHVIDANDDMFDDVTNQGVSLQITRPLPGGHELVSISAYQNWENQARAQAGALNAELQVNNQETLYDNLSQELRIASPRGGRLEYLAGLYLFYQDTHFFQGLTVGPDATRLYPARQCGTGAACRPVPGDTATSIFDQETRSYALFGTATYKVTDQIDVTGGLRYSADDKEAYIAHGHKAGTSQILRNLNPANIIGDVSRDEDKWTWSANARYRPRDGLMFFATAATGFKSGGFNSRRIRAGTPFEFEPERSITYEAGMKSELLDNRLVLNVTVFDMKLRDFQESVFNVEAGSGFIVGNAGERVVKGVEADFRARPFAGFSLDGGVSYMDAEFTDRQDGPCPVDREPDGVLPGTCDFNGLRPEKSPKWKYSLAGQYTWALAGDLEASVRGELSYTGAQYLETSLDSPSFQESVTLLNMRATIGRADGRWELAAWARNLTDETYYYAISPLPAAATISTGGTAGARGWVGWYAPPRTYGVELNLRY